MPAISTTSAFVTVVIELDSRSVSIVYQDRVPWRSLSVGALGIFHEAIEPPTNNPLGLLKTSLIPIIRSWTSAGVQSSPETDIDWRSRQCVVSQTQGWPHAPAKNAFAKTPAQRHEERMSAAAQLEG